MPFLLHSRAQLCPILRALPPLLYLKLCFNWKVHILPGNGTVSLNPTICGYSFNLLFASGTETLIRSSFSTPSLTTLCTTKLVPSSISIRVSPPIVQFSLCLPKQLAKVLHRTTLDTTSDIILVYYPVVDALLIGFLLNCSCLISYSSPTPSSWGWDATCRIVVRASPNRRGRRSIKLLGRKSLKRPAAP